MPQPCARCRQTKPVHDYHYGAVNTEEDETAIVTVDFHVPLCDDCGLLVGAIIGAVTNTIDPIAEGHLEIEEIVLADLRRVTKTS